MLSAMREGVRLIYVDLDHTLVRIDLLRERLLLAILRRPLMLVRALAWLANGGRARLKTEVAKTCALDVATLPFNEDLLALLRAEQAAGANLVLATAAPHAWAQTISEHVGLFDRVLATDSANGNLKGRRKLAKILSDSGGQPFAYAGDAPSDRPIFEAAELPIVIGRHAGLAGQHADRAVLLSNSSSTTEWWKSLRPHQWSKNVLIFAPAIAAHRLDALWPDGVLAFIAFCLVASALYLLNDFSDIDADRLHPDKRLRSQAVGALCPSHALLISGTLLAAAAGLVATLPGRFGLLVFAYAFINILYSVALKKIVVMDLVTLAFLYTLRVFAGGEACRVDVSNWMFAFIFFLALSLSHLKRYTELAQRVERGLGSGARRTYKVEDMPLLMKVGLDSGLISVLVLSLYITSPQTVSLYRSPALLFVICLFLFYWIERIWFWACRHRVNGDPIVFIVTDRVSYLISVAALAILWFAANY